MTARDADAAGMRGAGALAATGSAEAAPAGADPEAVRTYLRDHVLIPWSAQGGQAPLVLTGGEGSWLHAADGRRLLDFSSQLVNSNLGHGHPRVVAAIERQARRLCYVAPSFGEESRAVLAKMLADVTPGDLSKTLFTTGGAEAIESAIKIARLVTGRHKILTQWRSFHGATQGAMTAGGDNRRWANEPGIAGIVHFLNPDPYRSVFGDDAQAALAHVEEVIWYEGPDNIAAILLEPIVGTSGLIVPPDGYLAGLRALCERYGLLLVADEVMTGFGRTGRWFAVEHEGVVPDLLTFAKGVTSGYVPLGGVIVREPIARHFDDHVLWSGLTYSGHALACAAGVEAIQVYRDEGLIERSAVLGDRLLEGARRLMAVHPSVGDVRGRGLFVGIELVKDRATKEMLERWNGPTQKLAAALRAALFERGVYVFCRWNMLFLAPPLVAREHEIEFGLAAVDEALRVADRYAETGRL